MYDDIHVFDLEDILKGWGLAVLLTAGIGFALKFLSKYLTLNIENNIDVLVILGVFALVMLWLFFCPKILRKSVDEAFGILPATGSAVGIVLAFASWFAHKNPDMIEHINNSYIRPELGFEIPLDRIGNSELLTYGCIIGGLLFTALMVFWTLYDGFYKPWENLVIIPTMLISGLCYLTFALGAILLAFVMLAVAIGLAIVLGIFAIMGGGVALPSSSAEKSKGVWQTVTENQTDTNQTKEKSKVELWRMNGMMRQNIQVNSDQTLYKDPDTGEWRKISELKK